MKKKVRMEKVMSKVSFSQNQLQAINADKGNFLVSAGAGSGKTAVLIERLIRLLTTKKSTIDQLLVVTFTDLAAQELKIRLKEGLNKQKLFEMASQVDSSDICTFDAFALSIVKKYGYLQNISSEATILDDSIYQYELEKVIDQVLDQYYIEKSDLFIEFISKFVKRDDSPVKELIKAFINRANLALNTEIFVKNFVENNYSDGVFNGYVNNLVTLIKKCIYTMDEAIDGIDNEKKQAMMKEEVNLYDYCQYLDDYHRVDLGHKRVGATGLDDDEKYYFRKFAKARDEISSILDLGLKDQLYNIFKKEQTYAELIVEIYNKIIAKINVFKLENNAFTFNDIAKQAYSLASIDEVKQILKNKYEFILIDEYQDTSDIQEAFINLFANNNVYVVGDIKQSIYRFRNANPTIFKEKYALYKDKPSLGTNIDLVDNYRSRKEVLNPINQIMKEVMTLDLGGADYARDHVIGYGNKSFSSIEVANQNYNLRTINYEGKEGNPQIEAEIIAQDIIKKINSKYQIKVAKENKTRDIEFKDFTILISKRTNYFYFKKVFAKYHIPLFTDENQNITYSQIVMNLQSALKIINGLISSNEDDDFIYSLVSFMRGYINQYKDQKIFDLIRKNPRSYREDSLYIKLKAIANETTNKPLSFLVTKLLETFDFSSKIIEIGNQNANLDKLLSLVNIIKSLEKFNYTITDLIEYFKFASQNEQEAEVKELRLVDNAVSMMTVHASKGLEFPIVYFPILYSRYNMKEANNPNKVSAKHGLIITNNLPSNVPTINRFFYKKSEQLETKSESIRLAYVAFTRAVEQMIMICPTLEENVEDINDANSFLQLLNMTTTFNKSKEPFVNEPELTLDGKMHADSSYLPTIEEHHEIVNKVEIARFSKQISLTDDVDQSILDEGNYIHQIFELINYDSRDLSFIQEIKIRNKVEKILHLPMFLNANSKNTYNEYAFSYQNETGVIDLFIIEEDCIQLIDFKLSNIDDPNYDKQVERYAQVLQSLFNKPVYGYLVSLNKQTYRKITI